MIRRVLFLSNAIVVATFGSGCRNCEELEIQVQDQGPLPGFAGTISLDDKETARLDPRKLRGARRPCRSPVLARVNRVVDGDTIVVRTSEKGAEHSVRLIGIDTPEIGRRGRPSECYARVAERFTRQLSGHVVWLAFDRECLDRYERWLAYVYVGEDPAQVWQRQVLRRGLGKWIVVGDNDALAQTLRRDEAYARRNGVGMWSVCTRSESRERAREQKAPDSVAPEAELEAACFAGSQAACDRLGH